MITELKAKAIFEQAALVEKDNFDALAAKAFMRCLSRKHISFRLPDARSFVWFECTVLSKDTNCFTMVT